MNVTFLDVQSLIKAQVDFVDDQFETITEEVVAAAGSCQLQALIVDQSKGEEDVSGTVSGLADIAQTVGKAFGNLSSEDKQTLKSAVGKLITYPENPTLEGSLEGLFSAYVDLLDAIKKLNDYVAGRLNGD